MQRHARRRLALVLALVAVGCSGGGGGCGSSCGGAFKTTNPDGSPFVYTGDRLPNVAQVRVTKSGFNFLNAQHLNDILSGLNAGTSGGFTIPCIDAGTLLTCSQTLNFTQFSAMVADQNFNNTCEANEGAKLYLTFKDVSWQMDPANNVLNAHIVTHIKTGDIYVHSKEDHSSICSGYPALMRVWLNDEAAGLPQKDTAIDLALSFSTTPDGRLEINVPDSSLATILQNFQPGAFGFDGLSGSDPAAPTTQVGVYHNDGCDSGDGTYTPSDGSSLNGGCAHLISDLSAGCDFSDQNQQGVCLVLAYVRDYLLNYVKLTLKDRIVAMVRAQLDDRRCVRAKDAQGNAIACTNSGQCGNDDDGNALACDTARGVCYPPSQGNSAYNCEPVALGIAGQLDLSALSDKIGFPPNSPLNVFAGLGSKGGSASVDNNGIQLAAEAGTSPAFNTRAACVPPPYSFTSHPPPPLDFDSLNNQPTGMSPYSVGFSVASGMLNRAFYDMYNAGMLCVAVTNKTTSMISTGIFDKFLPSIDLVAGRQERPMMILLRPTSPPYARIGRNTYSTSSDGTITLTDPLITLQFKGMNLDFYALVDERQVRLFTLQADISLPLSLRTFPDPDTERLQPVLGSLDSLITNITALSADGGAYDNRKDILSDDPGVVSDLLKAAVRLAQPLLAGVIKPIDLPMLLKQCNPVGSTNCTALQLGVQGIAGAVAMADVANDGYEHLAVWASLNECVGACNTAARYSVKTEVRVANRILPDSIKEIRGGNYPAIELDVSSRTARNAVTEFSYRVDGSLWGPWMTGPRLLIKDPLFLSQGHHLIEVTSREQGDDHTMDMQPVAVDFFVSYEPPVVKLTQRPDGAIVTSARSAASPSERLLYSYKIDGDTRWTQPGEPRVWTQQELNGHGVTVSVSDEAGRAAQAHFGLEEGMDLAAAGMVGGCSTSAHQTAWSLLPLFALISLQIARRRRQARSR